MSRADRFALILSLLAGLVSYWVTVRIFEEMPHIEDEMAYVWQARVIAAGRLTVPSPPEPKSFLVPFVVDYEGQRFGKYPLGWPALLAVGVKLGARSLVNPLLAGLGVWLTYRLGKRVFGETVGLLAALLTITSPFFLMNSGSLLSHPMGLFLSASFALAWLDAFGDPPTNEEPPSQRWLPTLAAAAALGLLALTRPLTAIAIGLPFGLHGLYLLLRGDWTVRRRLLALGAIVLAIGSLHFLWQYVVTGDPGLNPYILWWPYDQVGFGPGHGRISGGHNLRQAYVNTRFSLISGAYDLFGWGPYSWIFLPFGLLATLGRPRRPGFRRDALLVGSVFVSLLIIYMSYWIGSSLFGPRYYYEGLFSLTLYSAAGVAWLAGWPTQPGVPWTDRRGWWKARPLSITALLALLLSANLLFYTPMRLGGMYGLYEIKHSLQEPFLTPKSQELTPALVVIHPRRWMGYGVMLELEDPFLTSPFIFIHSRGPEIDEKVAAQFPDRKIYHFYPDEPDRLYTTPRS